MLCCLNIKMNKSKDQLLLNDFIKSNNVEKFMEHFTSVKFGNTYLRKKSGIAADNKQQESSPLDEFGLLTEIVKYERVNFLEAINKKQLFPITQKDEYTGDNLLHFAVFENKTDFIYKILHLYENEVNVKNARGNSPFHYACLKGNIEIVLNLFEMK